MAQRIVKFETRVGPMWIDLEQVAFITHGHPGRNGRPTLILKSGFVVSIHESFSEDICKALDAWMKHVNRRKDHAVSSHAPEVDPGYPGDVAASGVE